MNYNLLAELPFKLGNAINFWLSYQHSLEKGEILEEKLNLPICEFLHAKKNSKVEPEFSHPRLKQKRGDIKAIFSNLDPKNKGG